jgi:hypothetical protein
MQVAEGDSDHEFNSRNAMGRKGVVAMVHIGAENLLAATRTQTLVANAFGMIECDDHNKDPARKV